MINLPSGHHICFLAENQASPHISWLQSYEIKKKKMFLISNFYEINGRLKEPLGSLLSCCPLDEFPNAFGAR